MWNVTIVDLTVTLRAENCERFQTPSKGTQTSICKHLSEIRNEMARQSFEQCSFLSCHWGANGIRTCASGGKIGGTCFNYPWTTAALCCSNSPDLNENKRKKTPSTVLCNTTLIWGINYTKYHGNPTDLSALHSCKATCWLYSLPHIMLQMKKHMYLSYSLVESI